MIICICGLWFSYSWAIGTLNTLFDNIIKDTEQSRPIDQIFNGKIATENLYTKALTMVKSEWMVSLKTTIQQMTDILSQKSNTSVKAQDIMNILYDTKGGKKKVAAAINTVKKWEKTSIAETEINASYTRLSKIIPDCKNSMNIDERVCIRERIRNQYYMIDNNYMDQNSFKELTYGEDLFTNGTLDDSAYDILVDIKNIGKILFSSFISPTETLFYTLPKNKSASNQSTLAAIANGLEGNGGLENMGTYGNTNWWTNGNGDIQGNGTQGNTNGNGNTDATPPILPDPALDNFISTTNTTATTKTNSTTTSSTTNLLWVAKWNICLPTVSAGQSNTNATTTTEYSTTTIQKYLDDIDAQTSQDNGPNNYIPPATEISGNIDNPSPAELASMNQLIEGKINSIFDTGSTQTCTAKCWDTTVGNKAACADQSLEQKPICIQNAISEGIICEIECLCFSIQYPKAGLGLEGMDGQLKLRFCTIPVQQNRVSKGKDIYGRDDSLTRIKSVFENLLNGGEMVKYARPKEYLDSPLAAIDFAKFISFEIKIYIKSLFSPIQNKAKQEETKNNAAKKASEIAGDTKNEALKNKYLNGYDVALQNAKKNIADSYDVIQKNIADEKAKINALKPKLDPQSVLENSKNKKSIVFNEQMDQFLEKNSNFRVQVGEQIETLNKTSNMIKTQINGLQ